VRMWAGITFFSQDMRRDGLEGTDGPTV